MNGGYNPAAAQLASQDIGAGKNIHEIIKAVREVKGPDGKFELKDLLGLGEIVDDIIDLFGYYAEGDPTDPNDDAYITERVISSGTAYGRGTGAFRRIGAPDEDPG